MQVNNYKLMGGKTFKINSNAMNRSLKVNQLTIDKEDPELKMKSDAMDVDTVKFAEENAVNELIDVLKLVAKTTTTMDLRFVWRALKDLSRIRKNLLNEVSLSALIHILYPDSSIYKKSLLKYVDGNKKSVVTEADSMRNDYPVSFYIAQVGKTSDEKYIEVVPEVNSFIHLLVQLYFLDNNKLEQLLSFNQTVVLPKILEYYNKRTLNHIFSKLWFYFVIGNERSGNKCDLEIRSQMIKYLKIATLKHDNETKAMLTNLILRNYLSAGDVESASDFVSKIDFPTVDVSSPLETRYCYYLSRINVIQLNYSTANEYIIAAIRKAPTTENSLGFLQQATKLHCVINLLMGDIPELSFFNQPSMQRSLEPYYHISLAVKHGNLKKFTSTIKAYKNQLIKDGNYQICVRLRSNVIKTGIRIISLTYKKISLKDICIKLHLESEQTAEYAVSRAIRDGVIEAKINNELGCIESNEILNIYDTNEPQALFDDRIKFVNQLHDESVKAMRYPDDKKKHSQNSQQQDEELDGELLDDLEDFSDLDDFGFL